MQAKEILKYKDLTVKMQHMGDVKNKSDAISNKVNLYQIKIIQKYLRNILGKHKIKEVQKTSILDNTPIHQNKLMLKYKTFNMGNNILCTKYLHHRTATAPYTLEIWFVAGI
jgi:hypothetical protein